jgi:hypothetical protein
MITTLKSSLWKHFGASIDMLRNAIELCPEELWYSNRKFYYMTYHTVVFIDYYTSMPPRNFTAALPYTLTEPAKLPADAIDDILPDKLHSKQELLAWLQVCRDKCRQLIANLTEEQLGQRWAADTPDINLTLSDPRVIQDSVLDVLFLNMRHVQHHTAQLNLILRQTINDAPDWVAHAGDNL